MALSTRTVFVTGSETCWWEHLEGVGLKDRDGTLELKLKEILRHPFPGGRYHRKRGLQTNQSIKFHQTPFQRITIAMPTRLPLPSDFPPSLNPRIHPSEPAPSPTSISNVVIFLHGLGDTSANFSHFSRALNLPETLTVTLQAPFPLPLPMEAGHYHWGDDILVDSGTGEVDPDCGLSKAATLLSEDVIKKVLISECGFKVREVLMLGYGQGGMASLAIARTLGPEMELGGVMSIGGPLPSSCMLVNGPKIRTPVLLLGGAKGLIARSNGVARTKGTFENVQYVQWKKGKDAMPASREEALPMMQFFARSLRSRKGVPKGSVEVG